MTSLHSAFEVRRAMKRGEPLYFDRIGCCSRTPAQHRSAIRRVIAVVRDEIESALQHTGRTRRAFERRAALALLEVRRLRAIKPRGGSR